MMKKNKYIRIISFVLCFVMLFAMSTLFAGAKEEAEEEYTPITWKMDEDVEYLYGDGKRFNRYYLRGDIYISPESSFYFDNHVYYNGTSCQVYGDSADPHIVFVNHKPKRALVFADAKGKAILDALVNETECIFYLENSNTTYTNINNELVEQLDNEYNYRISKTKWVEASELGEADIYEITGHDKLKTVEYQHGAVYIMPNGSYYYVCFEDLDNTYFDADGYFSYRSGSVRAYELDSDTLLSIKNTIDDLTPQQKRKIYEEDVINGICDIYGNPIDISDYSDDPDFRLASIISFYVVAVIAGIIVPLVLLVLGLSLANSKKMGKPKCWYALSAAAGLWILSAALILLIL